LGLYDEKEIVSTPRLWSLMIILATKLHNGIQWRVDRRIIVGIFLIGLDFFVIFHNSGSNSLIAGDS
jgi:hypothetical protein